MQYLIAINQTKALEWGLNAQQAMLFAFLHQVPTWARARQIDGQTFFNISKTKIVEELPLLTDKPDTAYRMMRALAKLGLLEMTSCDNKTYMRLTPKGVTWNRSKGSEINPSQEGEREGSEKNPTSEKSPSKLGKKSEGGSEKSPTNQGTNISTPSHSGAGEAQTPDWFGQGLDDAGKPLVDVAETAPGQDRPTERQQPMTLDWEPDHATWQRACWERGLAPDADVHQPLLDFREHFAAQQGRAATHADWTRRFARWVHENQRRQAPATGGAHHGNVSRQRTPSRRLTAAEARERDRRTHQGGDVFDGQFAPVE